MIVKKTNFLILGIYLFLLCYEKYIIKYIIYIYINNQIYLFFYIYVYYKNNLKYI